MMMNRSFRACCCVLRVFSLILCGLIVFQAALPAGEAVDEKILTGKTISVIGDSISTYYGYSDRYPITDEGYTYRYAEPYYGPAGSDCHNTELLVTDTWWHQAATQLGAEILVSNASNSTGLLFASAANPDWQQYLQDMLVYKTRPYHLGVNGRQPDVIALYIGSNEAAKTPVTSYGSIDDVDFDTLIQRTEGGYAYATPVTVAESYCIMLHKIRATYPDAMVYCFTVVPNSSGTMTVMEKRLNSASRLNEMITGVAAYFDCPVVDLAAAFALDPDGDGKMTQTDLDLFKTFFNNDPHPNAKGFDVITECFVNTVLATYPAAANPATGDAFPLPVCIALFVLSAAGLLALLRSVRKTRRA